jgi:RHS repeat-associated protein
MILFFILIILGLILSFLSKRAYGVFSKDRITPFRGILALFIILHHIYLYGHYPALSEFKSWGAIAVSIFLFVSGYGLNKSYLLKGTAYLSDFLKKRIFNYDSNNKDLLKDVSEYLPNTDRIKHITLSDYDNLGNPCKIGQNVLEWSKGNRLTSYKGNTYYYNAEGLRIGKKTSNNIDVKYYLDGSRIIREVRGNKKLDYYYDESGLVGFSLNGKIYLYIKNILNDIIGITDTTGTLLAEYVYDAYGNHKVCDDNETERNEEEFVGNINPFRYRGYYYDVETELFMVGHRYYNPEWGRWLSPDDIEYLDPQSINGLNLYAYCFNNPVMYKDSNGHYPEIIGVLMDGFSGFIQKLGNIIINQGANYLNNELTIKQAQKIIRKKGLNQSARSLIREYSDDALESIKFGYNLKGLGKKIDNTLFYFDIANAIYYNAKSGSTTWLSESAVDVIYISSQAAIAGLCTILIPGVGWIVGIAVNLMIDNYIDNNNTIEKAKSRIRKYDDYYIFNKLFCSSIYK